MAIPITVPRLGWSMEEGIFVEWLRRDGEQIQTGEELFVLENEKATENIQALDPGILRITAASPKPGETVKVGQVLAYLVAAGEAAPAIDSSQQSAISSQRSAVRRAISAAMPTVPRSNEPLASPRARRVAKELRIDWHGIRGSGRNGRIRERDVRGAAQPSTAGGLIPHTQIRKTIAARMVAGVTQAAPVTLTTKVDATELVGLRTRLAANDVPPSYSDLIVKFAATALRQQPLLQAQWREDGLWVPEKIHIGIAVDTEAGLLAPVIHHADRLTLPQVAAEARKLIGLAREGRLTAEQMRGATFTVTNLGMFCVDAFTPIIQLPQCAVLGVGRIVREPAVVGESIVPRDMLTFSLTFDHRVVDGAPAARFLAELRRLVEQPDPGIQT